MTWDFAAAERARKERMQAIADFYGVSIFWLGGMEMAEIEHFEGLIRTEKAKMSAARTNGEPCQT